LYENLFVYIENYLDKKAMEKADFSRGENFEVIAKELGI
jgi:hypothetical protein